MANLHDNLKINMVAIMNKAYWLISLGTVEIWNKDPAQYWPIRLGLKTATLLIGCEPFTLHVGLPLFSVATSNSRCKNRSHLKPMGRISLQIGTSEKQTKLEG